TDGQAHAAAGRCRAFRPLARSVRGDGARNLSARGGSAFRRAGAADRGEPRTRHRQRPGRPARCRGTISARRIGSRAMTNRAHIVTPKESTNPYSGSSLVPMLIIGLVLTFAGMIAALALN